MTKPGAANESNEARRGHWMGRTLKVMIVDDEPAVVSALQVLFDLHDLPTVTAANPEAACRLLESESIGVVVQDMNFGADQTSGVEGVRLFDELRRQEPELPILLMTAWASLETAVQLIKSGAADYVAKPWDDDKLVATVRNLMQLRRLQIENLTRAERARHDREALRARHELCDIVYESEELHRSVALAVNVAGSDAPVMITGPSGAGKEKIAEIVQANSRRNETPFIRVNVGALPAELLEAELFGAEPGAFTGANERRIGRFEAADGGTLFLDEIDALPLAGQVKLLRVLQSGEFQRLGSSKTRHADVRVISATNADVRSAVEDGRFREDLYYRLNVIEIPVPPLADRADDVLPLARSFLLEASEGEPPALTEPAQVALLKHGWPGNVRELQNRMQRAALVATDGRIDTVDLGLEEEATQAAPVAEPADDAPLLEGPLAGERRRIERALEQASGVVAHAAETLGLSRQALYRRMDKLGIVVEKRLR